MSGILELYGPLEVSSQVKASQIEPLDAFRARDSIYNGHEVHALKSQRDDQAGATTGIPELAKEGVDAVADLGHVVTLED